jgi:hypothetical protein
MRLRADVPHGLRSAGNGGVRMGSAVFFTARTSAALSAAAAEPWPETLRVASVLGQETEGEAPPALCREGVSGGGVWSAPAPVPFARPARSSSRGCRGASRHLHVGTGGLATRIALQGNYVLERHNRN